MRIDFFFWLAPRSCPLETDTFFLGFAFVDCVLSDHWMTTMVSADTFTSMNNSLLCFAFLVSVIGLIEV